MIIGMAHTAYNTRDMEKSLRFYCDCLGFQKIFSLTKDDGAPWIEYLRVNEAQCIELFYGGEQPNLSAGDRAGYSHLCLEVDDIQEIAQQMREKGVELDSGPSQGKDRNWQCWVKDPDGNRIEFMQLSPDSPQRRCK